MTESCTLYRNNYSVLLPTARVVPFITETQPYQWQKHYKQIIKLYQNHHRLAFCCFAEWGEEVDRGQWGPEEDSGSGERETACTGGSSGGPP